MKIINLVKNLDYDMFDDVMIEKKLFKQAQCLDIMFLAVADEAMEIDSPELLVAATKLQEACRKTLMALHEIRNPKKPTSFVKQLIQEQTNNQLVVNSEDIKPKQLGESHAPTVDFRAEIEAKGVDRELATLDKIDRSKVARRKNEKLQKRPKAG